MTKYIPLWSVACLESLLAALKKGLRKLTFTDKNKREFCLVRTDGRSEPVSLTCQHFVYCSPSAVSHYELHSHVEILRQPAAGILCLSPMR